MSSPRRQRKSLEDAVVRELGRELGPRQVRRVLQVAAYLLYLHVQEGREVEWKDLMRVRAVRRPGRPIRSNLPHLRHKALRTRARGTLRIEPLGNLRRCLQRGLIDAPIYAEPEEEG